MKGRPKELESAKRVHIQAPEAWLKRIEAWRRKQPIMPNRSEAIRLLTDEGIQNWRTRK